MEFIRIAVLGLLLFPIAQAQPGTQPVSKLRFLFLDESPGAYSVKVNTHFQQLSTSPYAVSAPFTPEAGDHIDLYKTNPIADPKTGKIERIKIATVTPPINSASALVIVSPRPQLNGSATAPAYNIEVIDSDPRTFPAGSLRILNRGFAAMAAQFGPDQVVTQPGATQLVHPDADQRNRVYTKVAVQSAGNWKLIYNAMTIVRPTERVTGIFVYSPSGMIQNYTADEIEQHGPPPPAHFWLTFSESL